MNKKKTSKQSHAHKHPRQPKADPHISARGKTDVPGQNRKQNDSPEYDEHHDENRKAA